MITNSEIFFINFIFVVIYVILWKPIKLYKDGHLYITVAWLFVLIYFYYVIIEMNDDMREQIGQWQLIFPFYFMLVYLFLNYVTKKTMKPKIKPVVSVVFDFYKRNFQSRDWKWAIGFLLTNVIVNYFLVCDAYQKVCSEDGFAKLLFPSH